MSLARIALRISAIEALRGKTLVGDNVLDSQIGALDVGADGALRSNQEQPFISVYVEGGLNEKTTQKAALHYAGETDVLFEYGLTAAMTELDEDTGESTIVGFDIPATDAAFELTLDVVGRQIANALSDPKNEWAQIFRDLAPSTAKVVRRRTADASSGTRLAAHQCVMTVTPIMEPLQGGPLDGSSPYKKFLDKLAALPHGRGTKRAQILNALITSTPAATDYETWRRVLGLSKHNSELLGKGEGTWPSEVTAVIDSPYAPEPDNE